MHEGSCVFILPPFLRLQLYKEIFKAVKWTHFKQRGLYARLVGLSTSGTALALQADGLLGGGRREGRGVYITCWLLAFMNICRLDSISLVENELKKNRFFFMFCFMVSACKFWFNGCLVKWLEHSRSPSTHLRHSHAFSYDFVHNWMCEVGCSQGCQSAGFPQEFWESGGNWKVSTAK